MPQFPVAARAARRAAHVRLLAALAALLAVLAAPGTAAAAAGDLDPAFSDDGFGVYAIDTLTSDDFGIRSVAAIPQAGGRTLLVGSAYDSDAGELRLALLQLGADGEPDPGYGEDGVAFLPTTAGTLAVDAVEAPGGDVIVLADGRTDAVGGAYALTRVRPDGTLVGTFGTGGTAVTGYGALTGESCAVGPSGGCDATSGALTMHGSSHVVVGAVASADFARGDSLAPVHNATVARYDAATGALDLQFGDEDGDDGATVLTTPDGTTALGLVPAIDTGPAGDKIVLAEEIVAAGTGQRALVHRLDADGAPDGTFGTDGRVVVRFRPDVAEQAALDERPGAVAVLPDTGVAVAGRSNYLPSGGEQETDGVVARLDDGGEPVTGFGDGGVVVAGGEALTDRGFRALEVVDGALYAGGTEGSRTWLARFDDDGLDASFGDGGTVAGGLMNELADLAPTDDGFLVAAGSWWSSSDREWAAARFDLTDDRSPVNLTHPTVTPPDGATVGDDLAAGDGTWRYGGTVTYRWQRCAASRTSEAPPTTGCTDIPGATATTYTTDAADAGRHVRVVVTNVNGSSSASAASATTPVTQPTTAPQFTGTPVVEPAGTVPAGSTVRATWTATGTGPLTAEVRWFHCPTATTGPCFPVPADDAGDDAYTTSAADLGRFLRARVHLSGPGGGVVAETANATGVTAATGAVAPVATGAPAIAPTGSVVEGTTLRRTSDGAWDQADLTFTYRWERCADACTPIPGAGGPSYVTSGADAGRRVRLVVEARRGGGPAGSAASPTTAVTARPAPPREDEQRAQPAPEEPRPTNPFGLTGPVVTKDTTTTVTMPDVRGLQVDAAKARIAAAGIHATIDVRETVRAKPLKLPGKERLDVGDVSGQSVSGGTRLTTAIRAPRTIRLVTEAGPRATAATGGPSGPVCTGRAARDDLQGLGLGEVLDLLRAKRCTRVEVDFQVSRSARAVEVRRATKDGRDLALQVTVPGDPARMDLTPVFRQGAFNGRPSFGKDDWALSAGAMNIFGVQVLDRAGDTVDDAEVFVDASKVGADDVDGRTRNGLFATGFRPTQAGMVTVLVARRTEVGERIFGVGQFRVVERSRPFTAIDGQRYTARGDRAAAGARARAAAPGSWWDGLVRLASDLGLGALFGGASASPEQTLSTAARQNVGQVQLALGNPLSAAAGVVAVGGGNVVAVGGGNVVAVGGGNVVSVGGGNAIALAKGNVIAVGGGNVVGDSLVKSGEGRLMRLSASGVVAVGGGNVVAVGGGNVVAVGGGNVVAVGGGN